MPRCSESLRVSLAASSPITAQAVCEAVLDANCFQPTQHQHGPVDVIHAPAPEPRTIGLLLALDELNRASHWLVLQGIAITREALQHPSGNVHRRRIEHGVVVGEWNVLE